MSRDDRVEAKADTKARCPICDQPMVAAFKPFCSARCADADLGRWLTGRYAIPVAPDEDADDDGPDKPLA